MARMRSGKDIAKSPMVCGIFFWLDKNLKYTNLTNEYKETYQIIEAEDENIRDYVEFNDDIYYCGKDLISSLFNGFSSKRAGVFGSIVVLNNKLYDIFDQDILETLTDKKVYRIHHSWDRELISFNDQLYYTRQDTGSQGGELYRLNEIEGKFCGRTMVKQRLKYDRHFRILNENNFISSDHFSIALNGRLLPECYINGQPGSAIMHIECLDLGNVLDIFYSGYNNGLYRAKVNVKNRKLLSKEVVHDMGRRYRKFLLVTNENIHDKLVDMGENDG
ncbi:hypothetical protein ACFL1H_06695 [Nanoarchaeota archaeon]